MIRIRGTIEYEGGRLEPFEAGSAALAEWEIYALRHGYPLGTAAPPMLSLLYVAYVTLGVQEGFDVWRKSVFGIEPEETGEAAVPPTLPVPSPAFGSSSPSPSDGVLRT